jgi:hypothetical protein
MELQPADRGRDGSVVLVFRTSELPCKKSAETLLRLQVSLTLVILNHGIIPARMVVESGLLPVIGCVVIFKLKDVGHINA